MLTIILTTVIVRNLAQRRVKLKYDVMLSPWIIKCTKPSVA